MDINKLLLVSLCVMSGMAYGCPVVVAVQYTFDDGISKQFVENCKTGNTSAVKDICELVTFNKEKLHALELQQKENRTDENVEKISKLHCDMLKQCFYAKYQIGQASDECVHAVQKHAQYMYGDKWGEKKFQSVFDSGMTQKIQELVQNEVKAEKINQHIQKLQTVLDREETELRIIRRECDYELPSWW